MQSFDTKDNVVEPEEASLLLGAGYTRDRKPDGAALVTLDLQSKQRMQAANSARYHSVLAMEAARKMRRTRQKLKTGQEVCHHLKMMLASEPVSQPTTQTSDSTDSQFRLGF